MTLRVRFIPITVSLLLLVLAAAVQAQNVFVFPDPADSLNVQVFSGSPPGAAGTFLGAPGPAVSVVSSADGSLYHVISNSTVDSTITTNNTFVVNSRSGVQNTAATAGAITPDGRYLLTTAGALLISNANTGAEVATVNTGSAPRDVAVSIDSKFAIVISSVSRRAFKVDLTTFTEVGRMDIPGQLTGITAGPNGLFYVSATNKITVIDPETMTELARIPVNGTPEKLHITPDGKFGVATNATVSTGATIWIFDLMNNTLRSTIQSFQAGVNLVTMDPRLQVVSNTRVLATSAQTNFIYDVTIPGGAMDVWSVAGEGTPNDVTAMVKSREVPNARYLYYTEDLALKRVQLSDDNRAGAPATMARPAQTILNAGPPSTAVPANAIKYGDDQIIAISGAFDPISFLVTDVNGLPVFDAAVEYTAPEGVQIDGMSMTNMDGLVIATVNHGDVGGAIPVTARVGDSLDVTFNLAVTGGGGPGEPSGLRVVSGQGQLVPEDTLGFIGEIEPFVVQVTAPDGTPLEDQTVTWAITDGFGFLNTTVSETDAEGKAQARFESPHVGIILSYLQSMVTATYEEQSVDFWITTFPVSSLSGQQLPAPQITVLKPDPADPNFIGRTGETQEDAIRSIIVAGTGSLTGTPIPNVALTATTGNDPDLGPFVQCDGVFAMSDTEGFSSCNLQLGGQTGTDRVTVRVGGPFRRFENFTVTILPGAPAVINIVSGDQQQGDPGQTLPIPLVAEITDLSGNLLPGSIASWEVLDQGAVVLSDIETVADGRARVSATATLGNTAGAARVRVTSGTGSATFTLRVNVIVDRMNLVSGNNQVAITGQQFAQSLVVQLLDDQGNGVPNQDVGFTVVSGSATVGADTARTDPNGTASMPVRAGDTPGPVVVRATFENLPPVNFDLTVRLPGPALGPTSFTNGASGAPGLVPGSVAKIIGPGLAPGLQGCAIPDPYGALPMELAGVTVQFGPDSAPLMAPIYHVCNVDGQESVAVQAPFELNPGFTSATVRVRGGATAVDNIPVLPYQPGVFETVGLSGLRHGVVIRPDGSFVSPENPARRGEICGMFATGLGAINPTAGTNYAGVGGQNVLIDLVVGVNDAGVRVVGGEYAMNMIGVYVVYFEIPADTEIGPTRPLALAVRPPGQDLIFGNGSTIAIAP